MAFAAVEAIGYMPMALPVRPEAFLEEYRVVEIGNVLEFIDADNDAESFLLGDFFS